MNILAIESSCDETACAVIKDGTEILSNVVASSTAMHEKWGGIVPEVAAREQLASILPVLTETLSFLPNHENPIQCIHDSIDALAVTIGPGLIGSLLIGIETAKTIAFVTGKPIIPVNHVLAHMYANFLNSNQSSAISGQTKNSLNNKIVFPAISLVVSGGHTELFLMKNTKDITWLGGTIDDAAGEAFDKTARLLGFGHGGGLAIQKAASTYDKTKSVYTPKSPLPRPLIHDDTLNFSFSGLKTAILREVTWQKNNHFNSLIQDTAHPIDTNLSLPTNQIEQLSYEVQEAITDVLVSKTVKAASLHSAQSILISGGVAANLRLRDKFQSTINDQQLTLQFFAPPVEFCTDNAAYIGSYAFFIGVATDWHTISAIPDLSVEV